MKLQYLGDYRDAFKWDLLQWLCSRSDPAFDSLVFVPMLTPDDPVRKDGQIVHTRFAARPAIHQFVGGLRNHSLGINAVVALGTIEQEHCFRVIVHAPNGYFPNGRARHEYWSAVDPAACPETVVFLDPDNGFETQTLRGRKWVRHDEVAWFLDTLPESSGVVVYQHWPHRAWPNVFRDLLSRFSYVQHAAAVHDATLAFLLLARTPSTFERISTAARKYAEGHPKVKYVTLLASGAQQQT